MKNSQGFLPNHSQNTQWGAVSFPATLSLLAILLVGSLLFYFFPAVAEEVNVSADGNDVKKALTVELTTQFGDGQQFYAGDQVSLLLSLSESGYVHMIYSDSNQQAAMIFPNAFDKDHKYPQGDFMAIPAEESAFKLVVGPPFGIDTIWVFVTAEGLELKLNPGEGLSEFQVRAREKARKNKTSFGEAAVSFETLVR